MPRRDLIECTMMLNKEVDWQELGFVCDGRFLFTQRSLQTCLLPDRFARFLPSENPRDVRMTFTKCSPPPGRRTIPCSASASTPTRPSFPPT
jgi:hypothetical protein